ncbi:hypothetical protein MCGFDL_MCGFDL_01845, partial [Dysosmobacter welbionis]
APLEPVDTMMRRLCRALHRRHTLRHADIARVLCVLLALDTVDAAFNVPDFGQHCSGLFALALAVLFRVPMKSGIA